MRGSNLRTTGWHKAGAALTLVVSLAGAAYAGKLAVNVSNVQITPGTIYPGQQATLTYTLSGDATYAGALQEVDIQFLDASNTVKKTLTVPAGQPGAKNGPNTAVINSADVPAGGPYTVKVVAVPKASLTLSNALTDITDPADPALHFYNSRGVDVNRITGSPYYGRIYVSNGEAGTSGGRATVEGVYVLNPDLTEAFPTARATTADLATALGADQGWVASANSPFRPYVAPDGSVFINDASDPHGGLLVADPNVSTTSLKSFFPWPDGTNVIRDANTGAVTTQNGLIYGSTSSTWIEGTGSSRVMYNTDEDVPSPNNSNGVLQRNIGTANPPYDVAPTILSMTTANWYADMVKDSQGNFYVVSVGADDAKKYDKDGNLVATLPATGAGYFGIAINEATNTILIATNTGKVLKTDKSFASSTELITGIGGNVRDVAFDGEGWIYAVDSSDELLHVYVPAGTYTVNGGNASAATTLTVASNPVPGDVWPVGTGGLFTGPNGHKYGDAKVTLQDAVAVLRIAAGLDMVP